MPYQPADTMCIMQVRLRQVSFNKYYLKTIMTYYTFSNANVFYSPLRTSQDFFSKDQI